MLNNYKVLDELGKGAMGKVKLVFDVERNNLFAMKKFNKYLLQKKGNI